MLIERLGELRRLGELSRSARSSSCSPGWPTPSPLTLLVHEPLPVESADGCARAGWAAAEGQSIWAKERGGTTADQQEEAGCGGGMLVGAEGRGSHVHVPPLDATAGSGRSIDGEGAAVPLIEGEQPSGEGLGEARAMRAAAPEPRSEASDLAVSNSACFAKSACLGVGSTTSAAGADD